MELTKIELHKLIKAGEHLAINLLINRYGYDAFVARYGREIAGHRISLRDVGAEVYEAHHITKEVVIEPVEAQ